MLSFDTFTCWINESWLTELNIYTIAYFLHAYAASTPLGSFELLHQQKMTECPFYRSHIEFCTLANLHLNVFALRHACQMSIKHVCCHLKGLLDNLPHKHMQTSMLVNIQRSSFVDLTWYKLISIMLLNIHELWESEKKKERSPGRKQMKG